MCELCMKYWEVCVRYVRCMLVMCEVLGGVCEVCEMYVRYVCGCLFISDSHVEFFSMEWKIIY